MSIIMVFFFFWKYCYLANVNLVLIVFVDILLIAGQLCSNISFNLSCLFTWILCRWILNLSICKVLSLFMSTDIFLSCLPSISLLVSMWPEKTKLLLIRSLTLQVCFAAGVHLFIYNTSYSCSWKFLFMTMKWLHRIYKPLFNFSA